MALERSGQRRTRCVSLRHFFGIAMAAFALACSHVSPPPPEPGPHLVLPVGEASASIETSARVEGFAVVAGQLDVVVEVVGGDRGRVEGAVVEAVVGGFEVSFVGGVLCGEELGEVHVGEPFSCSGCLGGARW